MAMRTFGPNAVDWEQRIDLDRLRRDRLARITAELERSALGGLLCFDFSNIRYITATHIGTWAHRQADPLRPPAPRRRAGPVGLRLGGPPPPAVQPLARRRAAGPGRHLHAARRLPPRRRHRRGGGPQGRHGAARARPGRRAARRRRRRDAGPARRCARRASTWSTASRSSSRRAASRPPDEIGLLTQACSMVDAAYEELYGFLRPGVRENECVGLVSKVLYDLGSEYVEGVNAISGRALLAPPARLHRPRRPARRPRLLRHPAQPHRLPHLLLPLLRGGQRLAARCATPTRAAASTWTWPSRW